MICARIGIAAVLSLAIVPAYAEIGRGPGPGKAYISVEGGAQSSDGAAVSAHGDLQTNVGVNPNTAGAGAVLVQPGFVGTVITTGVGDPAAGQIVTATSVGVEK